MSSPRRFAPGFRLSILDALILIAGLVGTALTARHSLEIAVLVALPILHFFLFCNVFRIARKPELIWAASYILASLVAVRADRVCTTIFVGYNLTLAALLIAREMRRPYYHGIFWKTINPGLPQWWHKEMT